jgi:small neutral amino acid transporter SnatA (MarC family)
MVSKDPDRIATWIGALTLVMAITALVLASAERIERLIGKRAVEAVERLMGLILTAIAVEMLLGGIQRFVQNFK